jgi:CARDB protein
LIVTIRNQGDADAPASTTRVRFSPGGPTSLSTPAIPAGGSVDLPFLIPTNCFNNDCGFRITVDFSKGINEANEGNNEVDDLCLG